MKKLFILENKTEVLAVLTHTEKSYLDFKSEVEEIIKNEETDDFRVVKGLLTSLYGYEAMEIVASKEVSKKKGSF